MPDAAPDKRMIDLLMRTAKTAPTRGPGGCAAKRVANDRYGSYYLILYGIIFRQVQGGKWDSA